MMSQHYSMHHIHHTMLNILVQKLHCIIILSLSTCRTQGGKCQQIYKPQSSSIIIIIIMIIIIVIIIIEHLPDPRREVSTDWLLWEASSPLMNTLAGSENL